MTNPQFTATELEDERWLPIAGHEGRYDVSSLGRIRSLDRMVKHPTGSLKKWRGRILKPVIYSNGYCLVNLGDHRKAFSVHRLVAKAFIPNPDGKPHVNHLDGNKTNARVANLEWCTASENEQHSYDVLGKKINWAGLRAGWQHNKNAMSKQVYQHDLRGRFIRSHASTGDAARWLRENGIETATPGRVSTCCRGESAWAYGFIWTYDEAAVGAHIVMISALPQGVKLRDMNRFRVRQYPPMVLPL